MKLKEVLAKAKNDLRAANVSEPEASAEFLLREVLGKTRAELYADFEQEISSSEHKIYQGYIDRRLKHEPVWQIVGSVEFYGHSFAVNPDVLVPRPETELLVKEVIDSGVRGRVLDVGTGSGTIIVTLSQEMEGEFFASDISEKALLTAAENAERNGAKGQIEFRKGSLFEPWENEKFDVITANLPYIPTEDLGSLALDIHHYEPRIALEGGPGGLELYRELLADLPAHLSKKGLAVFEIWDDQGDRFREMATEIIPSLKVEIKKDLDGKKDRLVVIKT